MKQLSAIKPLHLLLASLLFLLSLTTTATEVVTYYHNDALGSPVAATDEQGNVIWREEYEPYGNRLTKEEGSKENEQFYTGKQEEAELGLQYFGARWYDPSIGRFISMDPVGFQEGNVHSFNRYAYANNNPYLFVDPDGNVPIPLILYAAYKGISIAADVATIAADIYAGNYGGAALTAAGMADPTGAANKLKKAQQVASLSKITKSAGQLGREGEAAASVITGAGKNSQKFTINGRNRIPDQVNASNIDTQTPLFLTEVKNVKSQSYTQQLRDNVDLVGAGGRVDIFVRGNSSNFGPQIPTKISGPLQKAHNDPSNPINIRPEL